MRQIKALCLNLTLVRCTRPCGPRTHQNSEHCICLISLVTVNAHLLTSKYADTFISNHIVSHHIISFSFSQLYLTTQRFHFIAALFFIMGLWLP